MEEPFTELPIVHQIVANKRDGQGKGEPFTGLQTIMMLSEALVHYEQQEAWGGDMVQAGRVIARVVDEILSLPTHAARRLDFFLTMRELRERGAIPELPPLPPLPPRD